MPDDRAVVRHQGAPVPFVSTGPTFRRSDVVIVGGGAAGILTAFHLLRRCAGLRLTIVDKRPYDGGVAYGTPQVDHLLNVQASQLSAVPEQPAHFLDWARCVDPGVGASSYLPRWAYGIYLRSLLSRFTSGSPDRVDRVHAQALSIERRRDAEVVRLGDGTHVVADTVVLALGNPAPRPLVDRDGRASNCAVVQDPFEPGAIGGIGRHDDVVVVGSALSAVDVVNALEREGHAGTIQMVSQRGRLPKAHCPCGCLAVATPAIEEAAARRAPPDVMLDVVRSATQRARADGRCWQPIFDGLRVHTDALWQSYSDAHRQRFMSNYRHAFDHHRHRIAPSVAVEMSRLTSSGRIRLMPGTVQDVTRTSNGQVVRLRSGDRLGPVACVVNATGPDLRTSAYGALAHRLVAETRARPGWGGFGIDVDDIGRVRDHEGHGSDTLFALGPVCRGARWETTAIPEIRQQAALIARAILGRNRPRSRPHVRTVPSRCGR